MIKGIGHAAFNVKDMEKTIAFYEETLGFKRAFDIPRPENGEPCTSGRCPQAGRRF